MVEYKVLEEVVKAKWVPRHCKKKYLHLLGSKLKEVSGVLKGTLSKEEAEWTYNFGTRGRHPLKEKEVAKKEDKT